MPQVFKKLPETWSEFLDVCDAIAANGYYPFAFKLSNIFSILEFKMFTWDMLGASDITMKDENGKLCSCWAIKI